eukprot:GFYU01021947.1.p1 GENE.GFYU01021947.1~~GFYU01021947.1.p1  ORF type:complete len:1213 (-),score=358.23 GFYU01021947.1:96-3734(-)
MSDPATEEVPKDAPDTPTGAGAGNEASEGGSTSGGKEGKDGAKAPAAQLFFKSAAHIIEALHKDLKRVKLERDNLASDVTRIEEKNAALEAATPLPEDQLAKAEAKIKSLKKEIKAKLPDREEWSKMLSDWAGEVGEEMKTKETEMVELGQKLKDVAANRQQIYDNYHKAKQYLKAYDEKVKGLNTDIEQKDGKINELTAEVTTLKESTVEKDALAKAEADLEEQKKAATALSDEVQKCKDEYTKTLEELTAVKTSMDAKQKEAEELTTVKGDLESSNATKDKEIVGLKEELQKLNADKSALDSSTAEAGKELESLKSQLQFAVDEVATLKGELKSMTEKCDALVVERTQLTEERDSLKGARDSLTEERDKLTGERDTLIAERDKLTRDLTSGDSALSEARAEANQWKTKAEATETDLSSTKGDLESARRQLAEATAEKARLTTDLKAAEGSSANTNNALKESEEMCEMQKNEIEKLSAQVKETSEANTALEKDKSELTSAKESLESRKAQLEEEVAKVSAEHTAATASLAAAQQQLADAQKQVETLTKSEEELTTYKESAITEVAELKKSLEQSTAELDAAKKDLSEGGSQLSELRESKDKLEASVAELTSTVEQLKTSKDEALEKMTTLEHERDALAKARAELERSCEGLGKQLEEANANVETLSTKGTHHVAEIAALNEKVGEFEEKVKDLEGEAASQSKAIIDLQKTQGETETALNDANAELEMAAATNKDLKQQLHEEKKKLSDAEAAVEKTAAEVEQLKEKVEGLDSLITELRREVEEKSHSLKEVRHEKKEREYTIHTLEGDVAKRDATIQSLEGKTFHLEGAIRDKDDTIERMTEQHSTAVTKLRKQLHSSGRQLETEKHRLMEKLTAKSEELEEAHYKVKSQEKLLDRKQQQLMKLEKKANSLRKTKSKIKESYEKVSDMLDLTLNINHEYCSNLDNALPEPEGLHIVAGGEGGASAGTDIGSPRLNGNHDGDDAAAVARAYGINNHNSEGLPRPGELPYNRPWRVNMRPETILPLSPRLPPSPYDGPTTMTHYRDDSGAIPTSPRRKRRPVSNSPERERRTVHHGSRLSPRPPSSGSPTSQQSGRPGRSASKLRLSQYPDDSEDDDIEEDMYSRDAEGVYFPYLISPQPVGAPPNPEAHSAELLRALQGILTTWQNHFTSEDEFKLCSSFLSLYNSAKELHDQRYVYRNKGMKPQSIDASQY